ncbi:MAG: hypothetical protein WC408_05705 [Candidatus Micrarchaeia archaeon]|jgi:hypothetical protein
MKRITEIFKKTFEAYGSNFKTISFFSIPFLVAFPVALFLSNYAALGSIFMRLDSIKWDMTPIEMGIIILLPIVSMLLFAFALIAINMIITSQRSMNKIAFYEMEKIEQRTYHLFEIFLAGFALSFIADIYLYQYGLHPTLGALISGIIALALLFVPQAIVIDGHKGWTAIRKSISTVRHRFSFVVLFLVVSAVLMLVNDAIFLNISSDATTFAYARYAAMVVNALVLLPFLEVFKVQVYLSKYTILN